MFISFYVIRIDVKTIYPADGKIIVKDYALSLAEKAVRCVAKIRQKENWRPSIEIDLPEIENKNCHPREPRQIAIKVYYDTGLENNTDNDLTKWMKERFPSWPVCVDVGAYGREGWEGYIDSVDLRKIPNVYFNTMIVSKFAGPASKSELDNLFKVVEKRHRRILVSRIYKWAVEGADYGKNLLEESNKHKYVRLDKRSTKEWKKEIARNEKIKEACKEFSKGKLRLERLINILSS